jgi:hypothetical protein
MSESPRRRFGSFTSPAAAIEVERARQAHARLERRELHARPPADDDTAFVVELSLEDRALFDSVVAIVAAEVEARGGTATHSTVLRRWVREKASALGILLPEKR